MGGLLNKEDTEQITWLLEVFADTFGTAPRIIFTDEGAALACALRRLALTDRFSDTTHLLCTWHMSLRLRKQCRPAFRDQSKWSAFAGKWWEIVKSTEQGLLDAEDIFTGQMQQLQELLAAGSVPGPAQSRALEHLVKLEAIRVQWAGCFTHDHPTHGCRSTQRCEGVHGGLRSCLNPSMTMCDCCQSLELYVERKHLSDSLHVVRRTRVWSRSRTPDVVRAFKDKWPQVSIVALEWLTNESNEAMNYVLDASFPGHHRYEPLKYALKAF